jgi:hypothetical protein
VDCTRPGRFGRHAPFPVTGCLFLPSESGRSLIMTLQKSDIGVTALALSVFLAGCATAQHTPPAEVTSRLPPATALIDRYVELIGGREAVLRPKSTRTLSTFEYPATGIRGRQEVFAARPNRLLTHLDIPGLGDVRSGYDGEIGWVIEPMGGARIVEGGELAEMHDQAWNTALVRDPSLLISRTTIARAEVDGVACYKVELVWKSGRVSHDCYGEGDGLLVATFHVQELPSGPIEVTTILRDYRQFGEVRLPSRTIQRMMQVETVLTIESVEFDVVDDAVFTLPAEIRARVPARTGGSGE